MNGDSTDCFFDPDLPGCREDEYMPPVDYRREPTSAELYYVIQAQIIF